MTSLLGQFSPYWDLALVAGVFILFFILGLFWGRRQAVLFIFGSYASYAVFNVLPKSGFESLRILGVNLEVFLFLALSLVFYLFLSFSGFRFKDSRGRKPSKDFYSLFLGSFFSVLLAGFLLSVSFSSLTPETLKELSALTQIGFVEGYAQVLWACLPVLGIIFLNKS